VPVPPPVVERKRAGIERRERVGIKEGQMRAAVVVLAVAMCLAVAPIGAQDAAKMPMSFTAFAVNLNQPPSAGGQRLPSAGTVQITLNRLSSSEDRAALVKAFKEGGQNALLRALQRVNPRVGFIRTPNSLGWDLRFAYREVNPDGTSRIVIATDRRIEFWEARNRPRVSDFPFTLIEMHLDKENTGEGRMAVAARISTARDGETIVIENYAISPVILNNIRLGQ
jgi:hypothetical protein